MLLSQNYKRQRRKIIELRRKSDHRKPNMKNPAKTYSEGCRTSRRPKLIVSLIWELSWTPNLNIMIDAGMS